METVCVVVHGFGSSKNSFTAKMMLEELPQRGIGAIAFDHPAHGESPVDGEFLRLGNCLADLTLVEAHANLLAPDAEIVYFASSFGAYVVLNYIAKMGKRNCRAFLRSAAVNMPQVILNRLTPERRKSLETSGEFIIGKDEYGYTRDLKLTQGFFDDLQSHNVFELWREGLAELLMIHGASDETILLSDARAFADKFHVPIIVVPDGDHMLSIPGAPELVLKCAVEFLGGQPC